MEVGTVTMNERQLIFWTNYQRWHHSSWRCVCESSAFENDRIPVRKLGLKRSSLSCWIHFLYPMYSAFFTSRKSWDDCSMTNKSPSSSRTRGASSLYSDSKDCLMPLQSVSQSVIICTYHFLWLYLVFMFILITFIHFSIFLLVIVFSSFFISALRCFFLFFSFPANLLCLLLWIRLKVECKEIVRLLRSGYTFWCLNKQRTHE